MRHFMSLFGDILFDNAQQPLLVKKLSKTKFLEIYSDKQIKKTDQNEIISKFLYTTIGRIIFNQKVREALFS